MRFHDEVALHNLLCIKTCYAHLQLLQRGGVLVFWPLFQGLPYPTLKCGYRADQTLATVHVVKPLCVNTLRHTCTPAAKFKPRYQGASTPYPDRGRASSKAVDEPSTFVARACRASLLVRLLQLYFSSLSLLRKLDPLTVTESYILRTATIEREQYPSPTSRPTILAHRALSTSI